MHSDTLWFPFINKSVIYPILPLNEALIMLNRLPVRRIFESVSKTGTLALIAESYKKKLFESILRGVDLGDNAGLSRGSSVVP